MIDTHATRVDALVERLQDDPYPVYAELRSLGRVLWSPRLRRWLALGLPEVLAVLREGRLSADRSRWEGFPPAARAAPGPRLMLFSDPPDHERLRTLVQKAFTPRVVEQLRPRIQQFVDRTLGEAQERGRMDLIADLAYPLPATVIAELLGVPPSDHAVFHAWSAALAGSLDPIASEERLQRATSAREELRRYLAGIIAGRRRAPQDDLISRLVAAEEQGDRLNGEELLQMCVLLLIAGHETTVNLIGNGVNALLEHPDQLDRLRRRPELIQSAVEELLRYDAPVQMTHRVAMDDLPLGGQWVRAGQMVMAVLGAANRDPETFAEPDRLDLARSPNHHVAFGQGIHYCLGAPLARAEGQIAIGRLVARFPDLRRDGEPQRRPNINLRGFESLPLAL